MRKSWASPARITAALAVALLSCACSGEDVGSTPEQITPTVSASTMTQGASPEAAADPEPADPERTVEQSTEAPDRDDATVDARDYQQGSNYFFQSPSGSIMCGIYEGYEATGCQMIDVDATAPPEMQECWNRGNTSGGAKVSGTGAEYVCTNQGIYVGPPVYGGERGGGRILEYGDVLIVRGVACASETTGVTCHMSDHGFHVSKETTSLF